MKWNIVLCLSFVMGRSCLATTQAPYASQCRLLDQVLSTIGSPSQTSSIALELLEQVALGRTSAISSGAEAQVGVPTGEFQKQEYNAPEVHACAFRAIGETDLQEAVNFLKNLKRADIGADTAGGPGCASECTSEPNSRPPIEARIPGAYCEGSRAGGALGPRAIVQQWGSFLDARRGEVDQAELVRPIW
jgi:hypothetical protein